MPNIVCSTRTGREEARSQKAQYRGVYNLYMKAMGVVPVRLDDEDLKRIDLLVKHQAFRSRNEAIKKMIKTMLSESTSDDQDVDKLVESLLKLNRTGGEPLILRLNKPATAVAFCGPAHLGMQLPLAPP